MKIIILAGGGGTRLFPLSRSNYPKQFLNIDSDKSLLEETIDRYLGVVSSKDIIIVTSEKYYFYVKEALNNCGSQESSIILEPFPRNTAPAIALAVRFCIDELKTSIEELLFVAPADHLIRPKDEFVFKVNQAIEAAKEDKLVTMGIKPDKPETGYGYIKAGTEWKCGFNVDKFVEKPDKETAEKYLKEGNYFWNSGMYSFSIKTFLEEMSIYQPEIYEKLSNTTYNEFLKSFGDLKGISIDYAIAEKSNKVLTIPLDLYWNDVGSWDSIYECLDKDELGNIYLGDCQTIDCKNSLLISKDRLITGIGLEDIIVVETNDVIMVCKKSESQKVKDIVDSLKHRNEVHDHTTCFRPWGKYTLLSQGEGYKVKKIFVNAGASLSLQLHKLRSEHWIVIKGVASVIIGGDDERVIRKNESIYVPKETLHRLMNKGTEPLEIIEIQNGSYLGEDDIIRFDDIYKRNGG